MLHLHTAAHTVPNPVKTRNGDHCLTANTEDGHSIVAVADGVSGAACDYMASRLACEGFGRHFQEGRGSNVEARCQQAITATNKELLLETGTCQGLKSTDWFLATN